MKKYKNLLLETNGPVLKVILNRASKGNAVNKETSTELMDLFTQLRYEPDIHFVVITGQGRFFTTGQDMPELFEGPKALPEVRAYQLDGNELTRKLQDLEQITIAAINGPMIGGGLALAIACDFRVMDSEAWTSLPEAQMGYFFTWGSTPRLVSLVGASKAKELIMLCDRIDANEAFRIGLVDKVAPSGQVDAVVEEMLTKLKSSPFLPIRLTKKIVNSLETTAVGNITVFEPELHQGANLTGIPQEGMQKLIDGFKNKNKKIV